MYKVAYKNRARLKVQYLEEFDRIDVQGKWDRLVADRAHLVRFLPQGMSAKDLLVADFSFLAEVYDDFTKYTSSLATDAERTAIINDLHSVFNYKSAHDKIARFLTEKIANIHHHCYYCDTEDVTSYDDEDGKHYNQFDVEHILDKGACPMVALSLFNFVPSCPHCNRNLKGTAFIGETLDRAKVLSPTVNSYDFYNKVHFVLVPRPGAQSQEVYKERPEDYEVDFVYNKTASAQLYRYVDKIFRLKIRYNRNELKGEAVRIKDLMRRNPPEHIQELADMEHISYDDMYEKIFEEKFRKENNYKTLKMYDDLLH